jgi:hypothetical protein
MGVFGIERPQQRSGKAIEKADQDRSPRIKRMPPTSFQALIPSLDSKL